MDIKKFFAEYDAQSKILSDDELEKMLTDACLSYPNEKPEDFSGLSALYNELGAFYRARQILDKAEDAFLKAKLFLERNVTETVEFDTGNFACCCSGGTTKGQVETNVDLRNTLDYATTINNLAELYRMKGEAVQALNMFTTAKDIYSKIEKVPEEVLASCYNNMGMAHLDLKCPQPAGECFEEALKLLDGSSNHFLLGTTTSNLGFAHLLSGDLAGAGVKMQAAAQHFLQSGGAEDQMYKACMGMYEKIAAKLDQQ